MKNIRIGTGIQYGSGGGVDIYALRELAKAEPVEFMRKVEALVQKGHISLNTLRRWDVLYAGLADVKVPITMEIAGANRAVMASAFPERLFSRGKRISAPVLLPIQFFCMDMTFSGQPGSWSQ